MQAFSGDCVICGAALSGIFRARLSSRTLSDHQNMVRQLEAGAH